MAISGLVMPESSSPFQLCVSMALRKQQFDSAAAAYYQACNIAGENDKIVVFGSFYAVAEIMRLQTKAE